MQRRWLDRYIETWHFEVQRRWCLRLRWSLRLGQGELLILLFPIRDLLVDLCFEGKLLRLLLQVILLIIVNLAHRVFQNGDQPILRDRVVKHYPALLFILVDRVVKVRLLHRLVGRLRERETLTARGRRNEAANLAIAWRVPLQTLDLVMQVVCAGVQMALCNRFMEWLLLCTVDQVQKVLVYILLLICVVIAFEQHRL